MNTVGWIGSYVGRGFSSVSGPFHPFGGAVDIIVVEQPDGSLKSSPWYVRFGKFQGVLKVREKIVHITVNDVEAGFYMYLDGRGQAYFIKKLVIEDGDSLSSSSSSSGEDTDGKSSSKQPTKSNSCKYETADSGSTTQINVSGEDVLESANSRRPGILGRVFGKKTTKNDKLLEEDIDGSVIRADSLESAELAADLLEMKWSTNLTPNRYNRDYAIRFSDQDTSKGVKDENLQTNDTKSDMTSPAHDNMLDNLGFSDTAREKDGGSHPSLQTLEKSVEGTGKHVFFSASENATRVSPVVQSVENNSPEETLTSSGDRDELGIINVDHDAGGGTLISEVVSSIEQVVDSHELDKHGSFTASRLSEEVNETDAVQSFCYCETGENSTAVPGVSTEQVTQNLCVSRGENLEACMHAKEMRDMNDSMSEENSQPEVDLLAEKDPSNVEGFEKNGNGTYSNSITLECSGSLVPPTDLSSESLEEEQLLFGDIDDCCDTVDRYIESISSDFKEIEVYPPTSSGCADRLKDCLVLDNESAPTLDKTIESDPPLVADGRKLKTVSSNIDIPASAIVQDEVTRMAISLPNMLSHDNNFPFTPNDQDSSIVVETTAVAEFAEEVKNISATPEIEKDSRSIDSSSRRWRSWSFSFKGARSMKNSISSMDEDVDSDAKSISNNTEKDVPRPKISEKIIMSNTPTSEQLATLNLKEGKNRVVFTFSTAMLGKQQVDAHIYLWRWDSKIVISDVDGTITRSDVLGQFMPMVGMDWSQTGVTNLFSAIKENGYQLLFLSARAISQAYLTRQFLINLMQNGKGLPEGPVLTSPDGIFPSLFREVVRRAPHEFKIACLQDVKALFPSDRNPYPFYAGFGNRLTDEISYLKVGIPIGKIFTINPKGQIVVNRHIDTRSYTSLHGLVNGMFPAMSSCEQQEDFNYWNYWKLPPPPID